MGITDGNILYCHGVSEGNLDRKTSTLEYKNRNVYDCFNHPFTYEFGSPDLNLPSITFDDRPCPYKRSRYTPDLLPTAIYVASKIYFINLTTPSYSQDILTYDDTNTFHVVNKYETFLGRVK